VSRSPGRRASTAVTWAAALLVLLPVAAVGAGVLTADRTSWARVAASGWPALTATTGLLVACTVLGTLVLGAGLAWLTTAYEFPMRRSLSWLLVLPTAVPGYILGLVWSSLLSYAGPVQTASRALLGPGFPPVRTLPVAAAVLTLTLYPYVYLLARAAFAEQAALPYGAARTLGLSPSRAARRVVLPLARPALAAGSLLVAVEVLSDFATVQYFGVDTLSVGIYRVWRGQFDRRAATVLALLVLAMALALVAVERLLRSGARYAAPVSDVRPVERLRLTGGRAAAACGACLIVLSLAVAVPVVTLALWSSTTPLTGPTGRGFATAAANSVLLGAQVAVVVAVLGLLVVHAARIDGRRRVRLAVQTTLFGYAVPGPVLAIGALMVFAGLRTALDALGLPGGRALVTGSVAALVAVYAVRFLALGFTTLDARLAAVSPSLTSAALSLGAAPRRVLTGVHLPLARSGLAVAAVLVAVDALKELPIVLLMRPFGFDTLAVRVWQLAADSRYEMAGLPALAIVVTAMIPVVLLFRTRRTPVAVGPPPVEPYADAPPAAPVRAQVPA
jgi:iron(III) transport system permease protein